MNKLHTPKICCYDNRYMNRIRLRLDGNTIDYDCPENEDIIEYAKTLQLVDTDYYDSFGYEANMCYNYALGLDHLQIDGCEEALTYIEDNYKPIKLNEAKEFDIIVFHDNIEDFPQHFAVIWDIQKVGRKTKITIRSKWGSMGIFEGNIKDLPKFYGTKFTIWRK